MIDSTEISMIDALFCIKTDGVNITTIFSKKVKGLAKSRNESR